MSNKNVTTKWWSLALISIFRYLLGIQRTNGSRFFRNEVKLWLSIWNAASTCFSFCSKERKKMFKSEVSGEMNCMNIKTFMLKWMICTNHILSFINWQYIRTTILMWRVSLYNLFEVMISIMFIFNQICRIHFRQELIRAMTKLSGKSHVNVTVNLKIKIDFVAKTECSSL